MKRRPSLRLGATLAALAAPALLLAGDAGAVRNPDYLDERPLEPATGRARQHAPTSWEAPRAMRKAWDQLLARHGAWRAIWDLDRGAPLRVFGEGIPAPGANADAGKAEAAAWQALVEHLELVAPRTALTDWSPISNVAHGPGGELRTVGFVQRHAGLPVLGGQVSFLFKRDRLIVMSSAALPGVDVAAPAHLAADVTSKAVAWIDGLYGATPRVLSVGDLAILPVVRERDDHQAPLEYRVVRTVVLDLDEPRARWDVYVDAATGAPVARRQTLMFGAGTVRYNAPARYPSGERLDYPAMRANLVVDAVSAVTDDAGGFGFDGAGPAAVTTLVTGPLVRVSNNGAAAVTSSLSVDDGGTGVWSAAGVPTEDAQVTAFVHAGLIKAFARTALNPQLPWLGRQLAVVVNESGSCNAYSTGDDIHFYRASNQCENTARLADVVYHEFGHSLHANSIIQGAGVFDSHLSEGISDYLAATTTGDPAMGRGFFLGGTSPLRHIDPAGREHRYPDDMSDVPHTSGLIIAGALWDLRKDLIASHGEAEGKRLADLMFYATIARGSEIASTYVEVLAADDDDGDLANGTPNKCAIDRAFGAHGLADPLLAVGLTPPVRDGLVISQTVREPAGGCTGAEVASVSVEWRPRGGAFQTLEGTRSGDTFRIELPPHPVDTILQYRVITRTADGSSYAFPQNKADPLYELHVGPLVPIFCTDFESDPFAAGWTHSASRGSSEWAWGTPAGRPNNGDPSGAFSGTGAVGTDLGIARDGLYEPDVTSELVSPVIDVTGYAGVRLVYRRWLDVEDGFYDRATVRVDGTVVWSNYASPDEDANFHHRDREWRVHELDLSAQAADGAVQVAFTLETDGGLEMGGWTLDDFCIMARGDGPDPEPEPEDDGGCCSTGGGLPTGSLALGLLTALALVRRRRRAA
ncbi:MAG: hypothetical protein HS111_27170 [Kofleriaceae bacterium]|nr:hypothetical protein [Kofleriaceae bacterium]MCL4228906.1 hypothetical protein [Myxococcales bacterium]